MTQFYTSVRRARNIVAGLFVPLTVIAALPWRLMLLAVLFTCLQRSYASSDSDANVIQVRNSTCGNAYELYKDDVVNLEWSHDDKHLHHTALFEKCTVILDNKGGNNDELCLKILSNITWFCSILIDIETSYHYWNHGSMEVELCLYGSTCSDRKNRRLYLNFMYSSWDKTYTLKLQAYLKEGYYPVNTYTTKAQDSWSSWNSDSSYGNIDDDNDGIIWKNPWFYIVVGVVVSCCLCAGICLRKRAGINRGQNTSITINNTNGVNATPYPDYGRANNRGPSSTPPRYQSASAPPDYNNLLLQCQNNGSGSNGYSNDNPSNQEVNNTNTDHLELSDMSNITRTADNVGDEDTCLVDGEENEFEEHNSNNLPPPPSYEEVLNNANRFPVNSSATTT